MLMLETAFQAPSLCSFVGDSIVACKTEPERTTTPSVVAIALKF